MAVKVDLTPSPHPLPLSAAERGRGPGGRGEVESNIVELFRPPHPSPATCGGTPSPLLNEVQERGGGSGEAAGGGVRLNSYVFAMAQGTVAKTDSE